MTPTPSLLSKFAEKARPAALLLLGWTPLFLNGCGALPVETKKKVLLLDYAEGRVTDVVMTDRLTGQKEVLFVSMPQKSMFLEGYIQGIITDYNDNPIQGVVVRALADGETASESGKAFQSSSFDAGVSDTNGIYRIRFSLPILDRMVDVRGKLLYNPNWEQEKINLGKAYEPQMKESPFHLVFSEKRGMLIFSEGIRKAIVAPVRSEQPAKAPLSGAKAPAPEKEEKKDKADDDMFKGFGFGP